MALWSAKGGVGVTVCAVGLAVVHAERIGATLLVDAAGDVPIVCGLPEPELGMWDWATSDPTPPIDALRRLEIPSSTDLTVLGAGRRHDAVGQPHDAVDPGRLTALAQLLATDERNVVVDLGVLDDRSPSRVGFADALEEQGASFLLVTRACYLAVRAVMRLPRRGDAMIVVREPGRSLGDRDLSQVLNLDVAAAIDVDSSVARSVDAGVLARRTPRPFRQQMARAAR